MWCALGRLSSNIYFLKTYRKERLFLLLVEVLSMLRDDLLRVLLRGRHLSVFSATGRMIMTMWCLKRQNCTYCSRRWICPKFPPPSVGASMLVLRKLSSIQHLHVLARSDVSGRRYYGAL